MKDMTLFHPVFVQVGLTFFLLFWMAKERVAAVRAGTVQRGPSGTRPVWVGRAGTVSNAFHNQLEMPMLFYAAVAFTLLAGASDGLTHVLAWGYAGLRLVHAAIHTTYNHIPHRFTVYVLSNIVLMAMWIRLAMAVLSPEIAAQ